MVADRTKGAEGDGGVLGRARAPFARAGLTRPREGRILGGVAAGLARRFDVRPSVMRLAWVVSVLIPGPQFLLYVALWILMPRDA